jgi:5'-nucleotidase/UDP-sugar diphosphatase
MRGRIGFGVLCSALSWGRRHAPPPLKKHSFLSLPSTRRLRRFRQLVFHTSLLALGCGDLPLSGQQPERTLTLLHTSDIHSRVWPFRSRISEFEAELGLGHAGAVEELGGIARLSTLLESERHRGASLWLDSGDALEGAEVFHRFGGRVELELLSSLGLNAMALGNHELSLSGSELGELLTRSASFPVLAANLRPELASPLAGLLTAGAIFDADGLRVAVVGVANLASPPNLVSPDNPWGLEAGASLAANVQSTIDQLSPQAALLVVLSHLGLDGDRALVQGTTGIDLVLGGHQHIVTREPDWQEDCASRALQDERGCSPRRVPIVHSGAYSKWLSRLELALAPDLATPGQLELADLTLSQLPLANSVAPEARVAAVLDSLGPPPEPSLAFLPEPLARASALGGDSPLGNLTADAMQLATEADVALLNSSALRGDLEQGVLGRSDLELAFPFDELWRLGWLSGRSLRQGLERAAWQSAARGCVSALQIAGLRLTMRCGACSARDSGCLELAHTAPLAGAELGDDELLLVALPAYLTLSGADFEDVAATTSEISGSVPDALARRLADLPRPEADDTSACVTSVRHWPTSRCASAFGPEACPLSTERAQRACRALPVVRGGRDGRIEMLP